MSTTSTHIHMRDEKFHFVALPVRAFNGFFSRTIRIGDTEIVIYADTAEQLAITFDDRVE